MIASTKLCCVTYALLRHLMHKAAEEPAKKVEAPMNNRQEKRAITKDFGLTALCKLIASEGAHGITEAELTSLAADYFEPSRRRIPTLPIVSLCVVSASRAARRWPVVEFAARWR
jgi:hypothetical protein